MNPERIKENGRAYDYILNTLREFISELERVRESGLKHESIENCINANLFDLITKLKKVGKDDSNA